MLPTSVCRMMHLESSLFELGSCSGGALLAHAQLATGSNLQMHKCANVHMYKSSASLGKSSSIGSAVAVTCFCTVLPNHACRTLRVYTCVLTFLVLFICSFVYPILQHFQGPQRTVNGTLGNIPWSHFQGVIHQTSLCSQIA
jgi:hypothetical protein